MKIEFYDVLNEEISFKVHGVSYNKEEGIFTRMDLNVAANIAGVNRETYSFVDEHGKFINNVYCHAREAAGGRIRFCTNSSSVAIRATLYNWSPAYAEKMVSGKYGFDVYVDTTEGSVYEGTISVDKVPESAGEVKIEGKIELGDAKKRNLTVYFPISIETKCVQIGVEKGYGIEEHDIAYKKNERIVYYGSSITQGGAVTKPGNTYVNIVGRNLNVDYLNLGVWGSAKGQSTFAKYIAVLEDMTLFVLDYDHNNANTVNLVDTHYAFYEMIRGAHPAIPIIMITRPNCRLDELHEEDAERYSTIDEMKAVIYASFTKAIANGDENVHFIDGKTFFAYSKEGLSDNVHPNDYGQAKMAEVVTIVLNRIYAGEKNIDYRRRN